MCPVDQSCKCSLQRPGFAVNSAASPGFDDAGWDVRWFGAVEATWERCMEPVQSLVFPNRERAASDDGILHRTWHPSQRVKAH